MSSQPASNKQTAPDLRQQAESQVSDCDVEHDTTWDDDEATVYVGSYLSEARSQALHRQTGDGSCYWRFRPNEHAVYLHGGNIHLMYAYPEWSLLNLAEYSTDVRRMLADEPIAQRLMLIAQSLMYFKTPAGEAYVELPSRSGRRSAVAVPVNDPAVRGFLEEASRRMVMDIAYAKVGIGELRPSILLGAAHWLERLARESDWIQDVRIRRYYDPERELYWVDAADGQLEGSYGECLIELPYMLPADRAYTRPRPRMIDSGRPHPADSPLELLPVRFERPQGFQPMPVDGELLDEFIASDDPVPIEEMLRPHLNAQDDAAWLGMLAWLIGAWHPDDGPYPVLVCYGETGSAKTMGQDMLARLVDPHAAPLLKMPKDRDEVFRRATERTVMIYDNLRSLPEWLQDELCKLSTKYTGVRLDRRYEFRRAVMLNGLEPMVSQPDLMARSLFVEMKPLPARIPDSVAWRNFEADLPQIQAAVLAIVQKGLSRYPDIARLMRSDDRLASNEAWLIACEEGAGLPAGTFSRVLRDNRQRGQTARADALPEVQTLVAFMDTQDGTWTGTGADLLTACRKLASGDLPPTANAFTRRLRSEQQALADTYGIQWDERRGKERLITLRRIGN